MQCLHTGRGVSCDPSLPHIVVGQEAEKRQEAGSWLRKSPSWWGSQGRKARIETKLCDMSDHIAAPARKQQRTVDSAQRTLSILGQELVPPTVRMGLPASLHLIRHAQRLVSEVTLDLVMLLILTITMKPS